MKSKWFIFSLFLGVTTASEQSISSEIPVNFNFSGWYVGSFIGYSQTNVKSIDTFQTDEDEPLLQEMNGFKTKTTLSGRNARVGLYGGYGLQDGLRYLGVEVEAILQNIRNNQRMSFQDAVGTLSSHNIKATLKDSYVLSFRGGYVFNPDSLLYLKMGVISSRWNISSEYPALIGNANITNPTYTTSKHQFGLLLGTGIEKAISNNFIVGAEVSYAQYKKISYNHPHMNRSSITPSAFSFNLKLSYKI